MTTIAWDGRFLAVDTQMQAGGYRCPQPVEKLRVEARKAFAFTGEYGFFGALVRWLIEGADPATYPLRDRAPSSCVLVVIRDRGGACSFEGSIPHPIPAQVPEAWGSGADFAIGAMLWGATAPEAVAVAIHANVQSGGFVRFVDTHHTPFVVQEWRDHEGWQEHRSQRHGRPDFEGMPDISTPRYAPPSIRVIWRPGPRSGMWADECTGRLLNGTGCGICKRCNREWHALKGHAEPGEMVHDGGEIGIQVTDRFLQAASRYGLAPTSPRWASWITDYNHAVEHGQGDTLALLREEQRTLELPEGVAIVEDPLRPPCAAGFRMRLVRDGRTVSRAAVAAVTGEWIDAAPPPSA